jgi:hypothetical protein
MSNRYLKSKFHQQLWAENYARHQESLRLGREQDRRERIGLAMFPSTSENSRGACSPLGGVAVEKSKESR